MNTRRKNQIKLLINNATAIHIFQKYTELESPIFDNCKQAIETRKHIDTKTDSSAASQNKLDKETKLSLEDLETDSEGTKNELSRN